MYSYTSIHFWNCRTYEILVNYLVFFGILLPILGS